MPEYYPHSQNYRFKFVNAEPFIMDDEELNKFWRTMYVEPVSGCWISTTAQDRDGYTNFYVAGRKGRRHRVAYEHFTGQKADNIIDHIICDNRTCCNPNHLMVSTFRDNTLRSETSPAAINARKVQCINGHDFDKVYLRTDKDGKIRERRVCSQCKRDRHYKVYVKVKDRK